MKIFSKNESLQNKNQTWNPFRTFFSLEFSWFHGTKVVWTGNSLLNFTKLYKISQNVTKCHKMSQNVTKFYKFVQICTKLPKTLLGLISWFFWLTKDGNPKLHWNLTLATHNLSSRRFKLLIILIVIRLRIEFWLYMGFIRLDRLFKIICFRFNFHIRNFDFDISFSEQHRFRLELKKEENVHFLQSCYVG